MFDVGDNLRLATWLVSILIDMNSSKTELVVFRIFKPIQLYSTGLLRLSYNFDGPQLFHFRYESQLFHFKNIIVNLSRIDASWPLCDQYVCANNSSNLVYVHIKHIYYWLL